MSEIDIKPQIRHVEYTIRINSDRLIVFTVFFWPLTHLYAMPNVT